MKMLPGTAFSEWFPSLKIGGYAATTSLGVMVTW